MRKSSISGLFSIAIFDDRRVTLVEGPVTGCVKLGPYLDFTAWFKWRNLTARIAYSFQNGM